jgi:O-acetyl-ADP-ribose deacetylase (regulator of RNase III)
LKIFLSGISLYILSAGTIFLVTLAVKAIFKYHLNNCKILTKKSPNEIFAEKQIGKTKIVLLYGDIQDETTDVIVNAANARLFAGSGVCGAIHSASGDTPFDECEEILKEQKRNKLNCGEAVLTSSGDLAPRIKAIVHAVGPDYRIKKQKENGSELLAACYHNSLALAYDTIGEPDYVSKSLQVKNFRSISFPSISTGIFQAPLDEAAPVALQTIKEFIEECPEAFEEVRVVLWPLSKDSKTAPAYQQALAKLE